MKTTRRIIALLLCAAMVFALGSVAFADSSVRPTSHTAVSSLTGISSVTVEGTTAYYEYDDNTGASVKYIRAMVPNTVSLEDLQAATVVINATGSNLTVADGNTTYTPTQNGNAYTYTLNLLNKRYSVSVTANNTTYTYWLAAGFAGHVAIDPNDALGIHGATIAGNTMSVYGSVAQGLYPGNTYYVNNSLSWTDVNSMIYYVSGGFTGSGTSFNMNLTLLSGSSVVPGGCVSGTANPYTYNSAATNRVFSITDGNTSRQYVVSAISSSSDEITISASNYKIDLTELENDDDYGDLYEDNISRIKAALNLYYKAGRHFHNTDSVMDVMLDFISFANGMFVDGDTYCSDTYLSSLNGIGEFSAGWSSGWMYIDGVYSSNCIVPNVGAADYNLGDAALFTWFYTVNYGNHYSGW